MGDTLIHQPVMLQEAIENLAINPQGVYIDGTYGRGGHSNEILQNLSNTGRLFAFDKDPAAVDYARQRHGDDPRFTIYHAPFTDIYSIIREQQMCQQIDGILLDIGVSSPQLDNAERGFSFMNDGPLDMRMDNSQGMTVADWLTQTDERELANVLYQYGEERKSRRIAYKILQAQAEEPITTTKRLAEIIATALPNREHSKHPATRSFQALRIFINQELQQLQDVLQQCLQVLKVGGRLVVISFHSLEDRIVKECFRPAQAPKGVPLTNAQLEAQITGFKPLTRAVKATQQEVKLNPRSRSAVLRVAEKLK